jgi:hypothetical protein
MAVLCVWLISSLILSGDSQCLRINPRSKLRRFGHILRKPLVSADITHDRETLEFVKSYFVRLQCTREHLVEGIDILKQCKSPQLESKTLG